MRTVRLLALFPLLGLLESGGSWPAHSQQPPPTIDVKVVKYAGLCDLVEQNKGKVILLDFWSTTCVPCRESFFHTVEMYDKYRDKGFVVISVSTFQLDEDNTEDTIKPAVLKFLKSQNATFINVILDEPPKVVMEKLRIMSIPCIYVFNRQGQWTQFKIDDIKADAKHRNVNVEQYVQHLLEKK